MENIAIGIFGEPLAPKALESALKESDENFNTSVFTSILTLVAFSFAFAYGDHAIPGDPDSWALLGGFYAGLTALAVWYWRGESRSRRRIASAELGEPLNHTVLAYMQRRYRIRSWIRQTALLVVMGGLLLWIALVLFSLMRHERLDTEGTITALGVRLGMFVLPAWILGKAVQGVRKNPYRTLLRSLDLFRRLEAAQCRAALASLLFDLRANRVLTVAWQRLQEPTRAPEADPQVADLEQPMSDDGGRPPAG